MAPILDPVNFFWGFQPHKSLIFFSSLTKSNSLQTRAQQEVERLSGVPNLPPALWWNSMFLFSVYLPWSWSLQSQERYRREMMRMIKKLMLMIMIIDNDRVEDDHDDYGKKRWCSYAGWRQMAPWGAEAPPQKPGRRPRNMKRKISKMKNIPKEKLYTWNQIWIRQWFNCTSISNLYTWEAELKGATTQFYCWCCICKRKKVCLINYSLFKILHDVVKKQERQLQLKIMQWWVNAGINTPVCSWPIACPNPTLPPSPLLP